MRATLIVNPAASSVTPRSIVLIQQILSKRFELSVIETARRNHATRIAENSARHRHDLVVVLGGDGTVNEAANGIADSETTLLALPGGSTNVFCRSLKLADDPLHALQQSLAALDANAVTRVGLGTINNRFFLFHAGCGFDAAVVEHVESQGELKRYLNHPLFLYSALRTWSKGLSEQRPHLNVKADGTLQASGYFTICLNTDPYTYLGNKPLYLLKDHTLDKKLAIVTLKSLRADRVAAVIARALRTNQSVAETKLATVVESCESAVIDSAQPIPVQVDGDFIGYQNNVELGYVPDVLKLVRFDRFLSASPA